MSRPNIPTQYKTCLNFKTTPTALTSGVASDIPFIDPDLIDNYNIHDPAGGTPEEFICAEDGVYIIAGVMSIVGAAGMEVTTNILINGAIQGVKTGFGSATLNYTDLIFILYPDLKRGDIVKLNVIQTNTGGSPQNITGTMILMRIGAAMI